MDAANLLKPSMARGRIRVIGATTLAEYRKYVEKVRYSLNFWGDPCLMAIVTRMPPLCAGSKKYL